MWLKVRESEEGVAVVEVREVAGGQKKIGVVPWLPGVVKGEGVEKIIIKTNKLFSGEKQLKSNCDFITLRLQKS